MADPTPDSPQAGPGQSVRPTAPDTPAPQQALGQAPKPGFATGPQGEKPAQSQQVNRSRVIITNPAPLEEAPAEPEKEPDNLPAATRAEMEAGKAALERRK